MKHRRAVLLGRGMTCVAIKRKAKRQNADEDLVESILYPAFVDCRNSVVFWKVPQAVQLFVLLVRQTCRCGRMWSVRGVIVAGKTALVTEKCVSVQLYPTQISHGLSWDRNRALL